jgi:hypothetical protein
MNHEGKDRMMHFYRRAGLRFFIVLCVFVHVMCMNCLAGNNEGVEYYKMISTVEYSGDGQFRDQTETSYSVTREVFANDRVRYSFLMSDPNAGKSRKASSDFSFVIDKKTGLMSAAGRDLAFWAQINNASVKSLDKVTKDYIGKTWKQTVDLSSVSGSPINDISFTLTAIDVRTRAFGNMIAVRTLSEPFFVTIDKGPLRCRVNSVYLFDQEVEDVYLCISVFVADTDVRGTKENFRHEVATYRTDSSGRPLDLSDVGKDFEALVAKVGLRRDSLQIEHEADLPNWAHEKGVPVAQVASICSGAVAEGAMNPSTLVSTVTAKTLGTQIYGAGGAAGGTSLYAKLVSGFGWNLPTLAIIGTAIAVPVIVSQDDDSSDYP